MPIDVPCRELEINTLDWLFNSGPTVQTIHGILIDGTTAEITNLIQRPNLSLADVVAFELPEATAATYTRTSLKAPAPLPIVFDSVSDQRSEIDRVIFATTITPGQVWPYLGLGVVARSRPWASRLLTATDVNADWVQFQTRGVTFVNGERVILTAEPGGVLPGGISANTVYQANIVATDANVTHFNLRTLGSTTNINITTAHTGNVRIRSVDGFLAKLTIEGTGSIGNPVLQRQQASGTFQFGLEAGIQAIA
ncbi:hypothetical protein H6F46_06860 [Limnothrix sp. FACHB-1083]|uniref:hypothetical protein n=1 Tax=unclassified Limnothrix TaxID=2632864 RepID=UPI00168067E1|nr:MULTISPECIES: hypothetical protein [unclassified Limnothrix]MBD2160413.1 hypothetical protein [Limnothrix sp. FACHB-1083]MBD2191114.1 hypothetical protein [Limnothrix sp. FACHB-1088]